MDEVLNCQTSELIPLLIEYKRELGRIFPIEKMKHLTNNEIIERIKKCLETRNLYETQIFKLDDVQKMSNEELITIFPLVKQTMELINYDYKSNMKNYINIINQRKNGKEFSFKEHLEALIISLLSNHKWGDSNIIANKDNIKKIFNNYNKSFFEKLDVEDVVKKLKKIHCTNPMIQKQIKSLPYNVEILKNIEKKYGTLDNFVLNNKPNEIANAFYDGQYKMGQVGKAFALDYLRRVGINTCKSSVQLERLFGSGRLGVVESNKATSSEVICIIKKISKLNNISELEVELILQYFCLSRCADICGDNPKCYKCCLRNICNYDKCKNLDS